MAKKTMFRAPKEKNIEEWVSGNKEKLIPVNTEDIIEPTVKEIKLPKSIGKRMTIDMPIDLHKAFKAKAVQEGRTMGSIINQLVENYVQN